jgi:PDZ domain-containing protein
VTIEQLPLARTDRSAPIALVVAFGALLIGIALAFIPLPYVVMMPGPVTNTLGSLDGKPIIEIPAPAQPGGAASYPAKGTLDFTTVRVNGGPGTTVNVYAVLGGLLDSSQAVVNEDEVFPKGVTQQQVKEENAALMTNSQEVAAAVAVRHTGKTVPVRVVIAEVAKNAPGASLLQAGDAFVSVDGSPVTKPQQVRDAVEKHKPGDDIALVVRRGSETKSITAQVGGTAAQPRLGVVLGLAYANPVGVKIHAGAVGGPSAGLMFSLGIYDLLTPGELTRGKPIAGTGTMADDGTVGPIGGIAQKLVGAKDGGARYFLAPKDNCSEVVGHIPDGLSVFKVSTFDDALTAVEAIAKGETANLPVCTAKEK